MEVIPQMLESLVHSTKCRFFKIQLQGTKCQFLISFVALIQHGWITVNYFKNPCLRGHGVSNARLPERDCTALLICQMLRVQLEEILLEGCLRPLRP